MSKKGHSTFENRQGNKISYKKDFHIDTTIEDILERNHKIYDLLFKIENLLEDKISEKLLWKIEDITEDIRFLLIDNNFKLDDFRLLPDNE